MPLWKKVYAFSVAILASADTDQRAFYKHFKRCFLNGKILDVRGNTNYVFALMFDLIKEFRTHRNQELIVQQLANLETAYPVIQRYTEDNLINAIDGSPPKKDLTAGIELSTDFKDVSREIELEHAEWFGEDGEDSEDDDEVGQDDLDDHLFEDDYDGREKYRFPPSDPIYTVTLEEELDRGYNCLETNITLNNRPLAKLRTRVNSLRADIEADRLFIQTMHSENEDSFSIFCFQLSTGNQLWQTKDVPPGGSLLIDTKQLRIEAGRNYGSEDNYLVLLDYDGNILEKNFRTGYDMIDAADEHFKSEEFDKAKQLYLRGLETAVSINWKIKAAKKLASIGKVTGDSLLYSQFSTQAAAFETEKAAEKDRSIAESARQNLPLADRLASRPTKGVSTSKDDGKISVYLQKRYKQDKDIGGK